MKESLHDFDSPSSSGRFQVPNKDQNNPLSFDSSKPSKLFYDLNLHYGLRKNKQKSLMFGSILPKILNTQQLPR